MDFNLDIVLFFIFSTSSYADALNPTVVYISPQQTEIHPALRPQVFHSGCLFAPFAALISVHENRINVTLAPAQTHHSYALYLSKTTLNDLQKDETTSAHQT